MTDRRNFLKGLLSSIGGIMIVKPQPLNDMIKEPEPTPPEQPQRMFFGGSSCAMKLTFDPSRKPEDEGYIGSYPYPYPYSDDVPMASNDPYPSGYLTVNISPEEEKRIRDARREWHKRNIEDAR